MFSRFSLIKTAAALAIWFGPSSSAAIAACQTWQLPAKFNAIEDSGAFVVFSLKKAGEGKYDGTVYYTDWKTSRDVEGKATARLDGPKLDITAAWGSAGGHFTHYNGSIDPSGSIGGLRKDPSLREGDKNREVFFKSKQKASCADTAKYSPGDRLTGGGRLAAQKRKEAQEASSSSPPTRPNAQRTELNVNRPGGDYRKFEVPIERYQSCREACEADGKCKAYTYVRAGVQGSKGVCWLKGSIPAKSANRCCVSGLIR
jgi:hypothetical protein